MDYEDFLTEIYTPLVTIRVISEMIFEKTNEDWKFFETNREECEEMISLVYAIRLMSENLLTVRKNEIETLEI